MNRRFRRNSTKASGKLISEFKDVLYARLNRANIFSQTLCRSMTIYYTILVEITVVCMISSSVFTDFKDRKLLYSAWIPFDYSTSNLYYIVYIHQVVALIGTSLLNVACDVIICGLLVHACSQQEILKYRLKRIIEKSNGNMGKIVGFHDYLYGSVCN